MFSNQLYEYVSLRRGQSKLRSLSAQRQSFNDARGIQSFLVPNANATNVHVQGELFFVFQIDERRPHIFS